MKMKSRRIPLKMEAGLANRDRSEYPLPPEDYRQPFTVNLQLKLNVSEIPPDGFQIKEKKNLGLLSVLPSLMSAGPLYYECFLSKTDKEIPVKGRIFLALKLPCSRCLQEFNFQLDSKLAVTYRPQEKVDHCSEKEIELKSADTDLYYYKEDILDLGPMLRDQIVLSLPFKPLCSPQCLGLCVSCGQNLNQNKCACEADNSDPRWNVFKEL